MIGGGDVQAGTALGRGGGFFQLGPEGGKLDFGEAGENDSKDRAEISTKLVGGVPKPFFQRNGAAVFFSGGDPPHAENFLKD